jgi:hypothetical protein
MMFSEMIIACSEKQTNLTSKVCGRHAVLLSNKGSDSQPYKGIRGENVNTDYYRAIGIAK